MLTQNLQHNLPFLKGCEVIVVNDDPTQSIRQNLQDFNITLVENTINYGFSKTVNIGIEKAQGKYILLLNNDVVLLNDSYLHCIKAFDANSQLFAVGFAQKDESGKISGKNRFYFKDGFFHHDYAHDLSYGNTGWAEGGSCLIDKHTFGLLGGFDESYAPFYWEDIDLSYRAWKAGYTVLFDPTVCVKHQHETTIGSFNTKDRIQSIAYRNQLLFIWKNITDVSLRRKHYLALAKHLFTSIINDHSFVNGFFQAILRQYGMMRARKQLPPTHTDHEILELFA